ncbi:MAG TPA: hypothetical protein VFD37_06355, partial [Solirubrobacterales bacterium]|nr:hypothetical protein [Solirubrobacterales bacterium]
MTPGPGTYLLGVAAVLATVAPAAWAAYRLRGGLIPEWDGAVARLSEAVLTIGLLTLIAQGLGAFGLLATPALIATALLCAAAAEW